MKHDDVDQLLADAGDRWRASQPPPPEPDLAHMQGPRLARGGSLVRLFIGVGAAALALTVLVVSLPDPTNPGSPASPPGTTGTPGAAATPSSPEPPASPALGRLTWFEEVRLSDDRLKVHLTFTGGPEYFAEDPCTVDYSASAEIADGVLSIGVHEVHHPAQATLQVGHGCDAMGYPRQLEVRLSEPFQGYEVRDLAGYTHFLSRPPGMVELDLPDGWLLRSEDTLIESPTGRWRQVFSPLPDPPRDTSPGKLNLIQAFNGPAHVEGAEELPPVDVNGSPARQWSDRGNGELVLVWRLEAHGLALVANDQDFSVEQLIALAESARLPSGQASPQPPPDPTPPGTPGPPAAASVLVDERVVRSPIEGTVSANGVWTGEEVIVSGGWRGDEDGFGLAGLSREGAAYDPVADSWREISPAGVARAEYLAVWSGNEMLVWGGSGADGVLSNGAAYDPRSDSWRDLAPAPAEWAAGYARALDNDSTNFAGVWTGSEWVLAYGWVGDEEYDIAHLSAYDPAADRWRELPNARISRTEGIELAWTGSELILGSLHVVSRLPIEANEWEPVSETPWGLPASSLTWIGDRVLAVVTRSEPGEAWRFLASWDPATDSWQALPQPPSSFGGSLLWDGRHAIGYGSGLAYDTVTNVWLEVPLAVERMDTVRIWTGGGLLIWGGWDCGLCPAGVYDEGVLLTPQW